MSKKAIIRQQTTFNIFPPWKKPCHNKVSTYLLFFIISSTASPVALQFRPSRVLQTPQIVGSPHLCHLATMPTCALIPISQSPHSTCQPLHTPLTNTCPPLPPFFKLPRTLTAHYTMAATTTTSLIPLSALTHPQLLFTVLAALLLLTNPIPSNSFLLEPRASDISAVPAFLPIEPTTSSIPPTLAPNRMPLFPSRGGNARAAPTGTLPTVPSNPSPPNPDQLQPNSAITPSGSAAVTSVASSLGNLGEVSMVLVCGLVLMWWLELMDK